MDQPVYSLRSRLASFGARLGRRIMWCGLGLVLSHSAATAANFSLFEPIGYSAQARYFAYEEYGLLSEIELAYSSIHVIDVEENRPIIGTPIIVETYQNGATFLGLTELNEARAEARSTAQSILDSLNIEHPVSIVAMIGDGEPGDGLKLSFGVPINHITGENSATRELTLTLFDTIAASSCAERMQDSPQGFSLEVLVADQTRMTYTDRQIARSRGCPFSYKLVAVVLPAGGSDPTSAIAIISALGHGVQTTRRGFLAVPIGTGDAE